MAGKLTFFENIDSIGEKKFEKEPDEVKVRKLYRAMKTLSPEMKQVVNLYYIQGYNQPEIAQMLGINQSSVSRRMKRAVEKLRKVINFLM